MAGRTCEDSPPAPLWNFVNHNHSDVGAFLEQVHEVALKAGVFGDDNDGTNNEIRQFVQQELKRRVNPEVSLK